MIKLHHRRCISTCIVLISGITLSAMLGCGDATNPDGEVSKEASATTLANTLDELESLKETICSAFSNGAPEDAHSALHEIGHTLEKLPTLANQTKQLSEESQTKLASAVESMFTDFAKLDDTLHGGPEADIQAIEKSLTEAFQQLKASIQ